MKANWPFLSLICLVLLSCNRQQPDIATQPYENEVRFTSGVITQFECDGAILYALNDKGHLSALNLTTLTPISIPQHSDTIKCLTKSAEGKLYCLYRNGNIRKIISPSEMPIIFTTDRLYVFNFFDLYAISDTLIYANVPSVGLYHLQKKRYYFPSYSFQGKEGMYASAMALPGHHISLIDSISHRIFLGISMGEWGGGLIAFDYTNNTFANTKLDYNNYISISTNKNDEIYGFASSQHMGMYSTAISEFNFADGEVENLISSTCFGKEHDSGNKTTNSHCFFPEVGLYWGASEFKPGTDSLLFYSEKGFRYGNFPSADGHLFSDLKPLIKPPVVQGVRRVVWLPQSGIAFLFQMPIGIGYYHNGHLTLLR